MSKLLDELLYTEQYCEQCKHRHCFECGRVVKHSTLCSKSDGWTSPPITPVLGLMCQECHIPEIGGNTEHLLTCSYHPDGGSVSRKKPHLKDRTVTETTKDGREVTMQRKDGLWETVDVCPEANCGAVLPEHMHTCPKVPTTEVNGKFYSRSVVCKQCGEEGGWHRSACKEKTVINDWKPVKLVKSCYDCGEEDPHHSDHCSQRKVTTTTTPAATKTTTSATGTTATYYNSCYHDGDEVVWNIGDLEFIIADKGGCDPWKADMIIDLAGNMSYGKGRFVMTEGPFANLNRWIHQAQIVQLNWPDYDIAPAPLEFWKEFLTLLPKKGKVMITCFGGHGRSGTCLAALMVASGIMSQDAIDIVRLRHCRKAIETRLQENYVRWLGEQNGEKEIKGPLPKASEEEYLDPGDTTTGTRLFEYCAWCGLDYKEGPQPFDTCDDCAPYVTAYSDELVEESGARDGHGERATVFHPDPNVTAANELILRERMPEQSNDVTRQLLGAALSSPSLWAGGD